ncbi:hypothetical protein PJI17_31835, partial [Mycobacterium kansasii]
EFLYLYQVKPNTNFPGFYFLGVWRGMGGSITTDPPTSNKHWKERWFWACGRWETSDPEPFVPQVSRTFCKPGDSAFCYLFSY